MIQYPMYYYWKYKLKKMEEKFRTLAVQKAESYIDIQEVPGNMGWYKKGTKERDIVFEELMRTEGEWRETWAWCMSFVQLIWMLTYKELKFSQKLIDAVDYCLTPGTIRSIIRYKEKFPGFVNMEPKPGSIMIMRSYKNGIAQDTGHAGIVKLYQPGILKNIEGNTNDEGKREGKEVAQMIRSYDKGLPFVTPKGTKKVIYGFIHPIISL